MKTANMTMIYDQKIYWNELKSIFILFYPVIFNLSLLYKNPNKTNKQPF